MTAAGTPRPANRGTPILPAWPGATSAGDPIRVDLTGLADVEGGSIATGSSTGQSVGESDLIQFAFDGTYSALADSLQIGLTGVSSSNDDLIALGLWLYLDIELEGGDVVDGIFSSRRIRACSRPIPRDA